MLRYLKHICMLIALLSVSGAMIAQESVSVERSDKTTFIKGKKYYLHEVQKGQTIYSIARTYEVEPKEVAVENPEVFDGLKAGQVLKIPAQVSQDLITGDSINLSTQKFIIHMVEKGETLYRLSKQYNVTVSEILKLNPDAEKGIKVGQALKIPRASMRATESTEKTTNKGQFIYYKVEAGETLYSIATKYGLKPNEIITYNPGAESVLSIGQVLKIPRGEIHEETESKAGNKSTPPPRSTKDTLIIHTVAAGETVYGIAHQYDVSVKTIYEDNPSAVYGINVGEELKIRKSVSSGGSESSSGPLRHTVKPGETLYSISRLYDVSVDQITGLNPGADLGLISGEVILIPGRGEKSSTEAEDKKRVIEAGIEKYPGDTILYIPDSLLYKIYPCEEYDHKARAQPYRVALMMPFFMDMRDSLELYGVRTSKTKLHMRVSGYAIEFYQGLLLALNDLKRQDISVELYVYDTEMNASQVQELLKKRELKDMDLIIGPATSANVETVGRFAQENGIFMVSPFSSLGRNLLGISYSFQTTPSSQARATVTAEYIANMPTMNIVLLHNGTKDEKDALAIYRAELNRAFNLSKGLDSLIIKEVNYAAVEMEGLKSALSMGLDNLIIMPSEDKPFVNDMVNKLNTLSVSIKKLYGGGYERKDNHRFVLLGTPEWCNYENLDLEYLKQLNFHYASTGFVDHERPEVKNFFATYKRTCSKDPSEYSFMGYDAALFFVSILKEHGTQFSGCVDSHQAPLLHSRYDFVKLGWDGGYENHGLFILRYGDDYRFEIANPVKDQ